MHLVEIHRVVDVQIPQIVTNLSLAYSRRDIASPVPSYWTKCLRAVRRAGVREDGDKKLLSTSAFPCQLLPACMCHSLGVYTPLDFPFLIEEPVEAFLVVFGISCYVQFKLALGFLTPSLHRLKASLYSSHDTFPCFHCLCIFLFISSIFSCTKQ